MAKKTAPDKTGEAEATPEKPKLEQSRSGAEMTVSGHLRELRNRILVCLAVLVLAMGIGLHFVADIVQALLAMGRPYNYQFVYIAPQELLLQYFSVDLLLALCVTLPVLLYEIWAFLRPGLRRNERILFLLGMFLGLLSAVAGVLFAYQILLPFMLRFLISLSEGSGVRPSVSVQNYISFLLTFFLIFAAIFELPAAALLFTRFGIIKVSWLKRARKFAIVLIFLIAAVITPPDIISQIMVAVPLIALYEFSIFLSSAANRFRKE